MYKVFIRPLLFLIDPEKVHHFVFGFIKIFLKIPFMQAIISLIYKSNNTNLKITVAGIDFPNPVGLAAGFDKDAKLFNELSCFGFGFIEIGTLTPLPQEGNLKPRMFRLKKDSALINRMGFNNSGVFKAAEKLKKKKNNVIVGGNIGKNKLTPNENAIDDYLKCFEALYSYVDYFVVNVSSPNTPGLRELQDKAPLTQLLTVVQENNLKKHKPKPVFLKIAPDITNSQLDDIIDIVIQTKIAGVIATNTTIDRNNLKTDKAFLDKIGNGGLSGKPLATRSTEVIRYLCKKSGNSFPVIGVGGIHSAKDAIEKIEAGASLVQIYTGFIYEGPGLIKKINCKIIERKDKNNRVPA
jgi:dihydroorotate dehydrogenase